MASSSHGDPQALPPAVNLHCLQCDAQIGAFDNNEWIRLTSSYVRSARPGTHLATEVAKRTQVVPDGVPHRAVEGCTLAEVFCMNCSATVGQYCISAPTPAQRHLVRQYFYKLTKTYLKSRETNERVDAIFGFSGDLVRPTTRPGLGSSSNLVPTSRWSPTPLRAGGTPSFSQSTMNLQSRPFEPSAFQTPSHEEAQNTAALQVALQDARLKSQEEKIMAQDLRIQQQDSQIRILTSLLDSFRATLDELKGTVLGLQSQRLETNLVGPSQNDLVGSLESMLRSVRNAQSNTREREELLAENASLKSRLQNIATAIGRSSEDTPSDLASTNALGKRKRNSELARSGRCLALSGGTAHNRSAECEDFPPSQQMPTPQSINPSIHSQDASNLSRNSSLERQQGRSPDQAVSEDDHQGPNRIDVSVIFDPSHQPGLHDSQQQQQQQQGHPNVPDNASCVAPDALPNNQSQHLDKGDQGLDNVGKGPMGLEPAKKSGARLSMGESVDFSSDDDEDNNDPRPPSNSENSHSVPAENQSLPQVPDSSVQDEPASKRTRSRSRVCSPNACAPASTVRGVAPEPDVQPRIRPRRLDLSGRFDVATPADVEEQIRKASLPRQLKPVVQTTAKILNYELTDLGLEEWIGKDKKTAEYRQVVREARERQREKNKMEKLASRGVAARSRGEESQDRLDQAFREATAALVDISNEQTISQHRPEAAGKGTNTGSRLTRKQQREEEIRRRDELAKAAMEMNN